MEQFLKDSPSDFGSNHNANMNFNYEVGEFMYENGNNAYEQQLRPQETDNFAIDKNEIMTPHNNYINDKSEFTSPLQNDHFLDDLETFTLRNQQTQYINPMQPNANNLDDIISPGSMGTLNFGNRDSTYLSPQYFSPPNDNSNFKGLKPVPKYGLFNSFDDAPTSPHESANAPFQGLNGLHNFQQGSDANPDIQLSPQSLQIVSPNNFDTPENFNNTRASAGSYLNSPPPNFPYMRPESLYTFSTSIPNTSSNMRRIVAPSSNTILGSSLPGSENNQTLSLGSTKQLSKEEKLKRRREFHNAVERRRRDLIKERIKELGLLVPPSLLNPQLSAVQNLQRNSQLNSKEINELLASIKVKETKPNKSTILHKSIDYINHLKYVSREQDKTRELLLRRLEELERIDSGDRVGLQPHNLSGLAPEVATEFFALKNEDIFNPDDILQNTYGSTSNSELLGDNMTQLL